MTACVLVALRCKRYRSTPTVRACSKDIYVIYIKSVAKVQVKVQYSCSSNVLVKSDGPREDASRLHKGLHCNRNHQLHLCSGVHGRDGFRAGDHMLSKAERTFQSRARCYKTGTTAVKACFSKPVVEHPSIQHRPLNTVITADA